MIPGIPLDRGLAPLINTGLGLDVVDKLMNTRNIARRIYAVMLLLKEHSDACERLWFDERGRCLDLGGRGANAGPSRGQLGV